MNYIDVRLQEVHLLYPTLFSIDDSFLLFKDNEQENRVLKGVLDHYEKASGQAINYQKSSLSFSKNTKANVQEQICAYFGILVALSHCKYLGLSSMVSHSKNEAFHYLRDQFRGRINSWK